MAGVRGWAWSGSLGRCCGGSGCAVRSDGSGGCPWGCPLLGPAPWSRALSGSLSLGVCRVLRGRVAWSLQLCWFRSHPVSLPPCRPPSLVSRPRPLSLRCPSPCVCVVASAVKGGQGRLLAVSVRRWVVRCSRWSPVWVHPLPLRGGLWLGGATQCGWCAFGSGLLRRVLVGAFLWGGLSCAPVWQCPLGVSRCRLGVGGRGGAGPSGVVCPSSLGVCPGAFPCVLPLP